METLDRIREASSVLPLGLDLRPFRDTGKSSTNEVPVLLWNHRWEYDKNPEAFFLLCRRLKARDLKFKLIVCGEHNKRHPAIFDVAYDEFQKEFLHWGYAEDQQQYTRLLASADIIPVTSNQDFFGGSAVEAIAAGCLPILPDRLAFPEHLPEDYRSTLTYETNDDLYSLAVQIIQGELQVPTAPLRKYVERYDWMEVVEQYDKRVESLELRV